MSKQLDSILQLAPRAMVEEKTAAKPAAKAAPRNVEKKPSSDKPEKAALKPVAERQERDVSLGADVPESVKRAVCIMAATEGVTNRTIILRALKSIGIAVPDDELRDRRK